MNVISFQRKGVIVHKVEHAETVFAIIPRIGELVTLSDLITGWAQKVDYDYTNPSRTEITIMIGDRP